ncbi:MAG: putative Ig domain-containing protein [Gluconacetobacter diazotrophicus]|nr:putative Ig domain-containing protein [Gluconacetobacter diazotrophicus]
MKATVSALLLLAAVLGEALPSSHAVAARAGSLDTSFTADVNGVVRAAVVQADGKIVLAGSFDKVNGTVHANLARLNADGTLDAAFTAGADADVLAVTVQADGKLLVGGEFSQVNGTFRNNLARLNADGTLDTAFSSSVGTMGPSGVFDLAFQSGGKSVVGGFASTTFGYGGSPTTYYYLARLNADGSNDASFDAPGNLSEPLGALAVQADGKILLVQNASLGGQFAVRIVRLNADGSSDASFVAPQTFDSTRFGDLLVQPDGQIVAGGPVQNFGSSEVLRLNAADGSADTGFQTAAVAGVVGKILRQPDGRLVVGGAFTQVAGGARRNLARLAADGTLDAGFVPPATMDGSVQALALQADGRLIVGGDFTRIDGVAHRGIARVYGADTATPQITSAAGAAGQVGMPFSYAITADNGPADFSAGTVYNANAGTGNPLPAGLTLDAAAGVISGTPTREGDYVLAIRAANATGADLKEVPLTIATAAGQAHPRFFTGEEPLSNGVYYLTFFYSGRQPANFFGYYAYLSDPRYLYHFDLGFEYVFDAADGDGGVYLYDFASSTFFYTSPAFPFPYLYDFSLGSVVYYFADPDAPDRYNTDGVRYFYVFNTYQIISK